MARDDDDDDDLLDEDDDDENDDADEDEDEDEDDDDEPDEEQVLRDIESAFRTERARIRGCDDLHELRAIRTECQALAASRDANPAARIRLNDLIELVDDRVTDLKAKR